MISLFSKKEEPVSPVKDKSSDNAIKTPERRYLVIGSSGYHGVDSLEWGAGAIPNIVDYDTVVVDVRSLDDERLKDVSHDFLVDIRTQLVRLLHSSGEIIVLTDFIHIDHRPDSYPERIDNYDWCPIKIGISNESGKTIVKKESRFEHYLKHLKDWPYYLYIPSSGLHRELTNYYGSTHNTQYKVPLSPFLVNRYDKVLAGSFRIVVRQDTAESDVVTGEVVLLPLIQNFDPKQAVALVLEDLVGSTVRDEDPDWVDAISVPGVEKIQEDIRQYRKSIAETFNEIEHLDTQRRALEEYKRLLFATGADLEKSLAKALVTLGGEITPAKYGEEEYILNFNGVEYLIEVKGVSKSITLAHLRQLNDYLLKYEEETAKPCKGILLGNAWRADPPDQRGTNEKTEFPDNVVKRATQWQIALISSTAFFSAFCAFLNNESLGTIILQQIVSAEGIVEFSLDNHTNK